MKGNLHDGVSLNWKWNDQVRFSMPKHVPNLIKRLRHVTPLQPQKSPYPVPHVECGKKIQTSPMEDDNPLLPAQGVKLIQNIIEAALCVVRIID